MILVGLNAYHGDASAALVIDGKLVAAAEEERFTRIKHCAGFPAHALRYCLKAGGVKAGEIHRIAIARDPKARLARKAVYAVKMPRLAIDRMTAHGKFATIKEQIAGALAVDIRDLTAEVHRVEHHKAHLASAFFVSPFEDAALLSVDGLGDFASTMWGVGRGNRLLIDGAVAFPHSLGIYYTALTQYLGFWNYGDEYKVMGLASYGEPEYRDAFAELVRLDNGRRGFSLGLRYFVHHRSGPEMTWKEGAPVLGQLYSKRLESLLGPARAPDAAIDTRHQNIAAALQGRLEEALVAMLNRLHERIRIKRLCLAGGVAFNCVANGKIFSQTPFEEVYIPAAAGDAGLAVGAAFYVWHQLLGAPRRFEMKHAQWGPAFGSHEIHDALGVKREALEKSNCEIREMLSIDELCRATASRIADGKIVGWFQGRMEFGPRALGNRSILVDPRRAEMKEVLNRRIKRRENFRPFAPSVLEEKTGEYFEQSHPSPFMLMAYKVRPDKREAIPAPTHVDGTARVQTVRRDETPVYWRLIKEFERRTGVPVLLNTSFNENEPVVCTPEQALDCFLRTEMDALAMGSFLIESNVAEAR